MIPLLGYLHTNISPQWAQAIAGFASAVAAIILAFLYYRMFDTQDDLKDIQEDLREIQGDVRDIEHTRIRPDLQIHGWEQRKNTQLDLDLVVANVGGHPTAIESVRLGGVKTSEGTTEVEYNIQPQIAGEDTPPFAPARQIDYILKPGDVVELRVGEGTYDGSQVQPPDVDDPYVEVEAVIGEVDEGNGTGAREELELG